MGKNNVSKELKKFNSSITLKGEELEHARKLAESINLDDDSSINNFALDTQKELGNTSSDILKETTAKEAGDAGDALLELVQQLGAYDTDDNFFEKTLKSLGLGKFVDTSKKIIKAHSSVESNITGIQTKLEGSRINLIKRNANIEALKDNKIAYLEKNKFNIEAIRIKQKEIKDVLLPKINKEIEEAVNDVDRNILTQKKNELNNKFISLSKKFTSLKLSNSATLNSLPRLEMAKAGNSELIANIQDSVLTAIPIWRDNVAEALILTEQKKTVKTLNAVSDFTNNLILNNAKNTKENMIAIAKESERAVIDIDTLEKSNKMLVETVTEVLSIKQQGAKERLETEKKLKLIDSEFRKNIDEVQNKVVDITEIESKIENLDYEVIEDDTNSNITSLVD